MSWNYLPPLAGHNPAVTVIFTVLVTVAIAALLTFAFAAMAGELSDSGWPALAVAAVAGVIAGIFWSITIHNGHGAPQAAYQQDLILLVCRNLILAVAILPIALAINGLGELFDPRSTEDKVHTFWWVVLFAFAAFGLVVAACIWPY